MIFVELTLDALDLGCPVKNVKKIKMLQIVWKPWKIDKKVKIQLSNMFLVNSLFS